MRSESGSSALLAQGLKQMCGSAEHPTRPFEESWWGVDKGEKMF